jgi:hypothetical protein
MTKPLASVPPERGDVSKADRGEDIPLQTSLFGETAVFPAQINPSGVITVSPPCFASAPRSGGTLDVMPHLQTSAGAITAFVFSCPGQREELLGHPCAGATGRNLDLALPKLHAQCPDLFTSPLRSAYVLTNSWPQIEYPAKTGRSEATATEILSPANLDRLERELTSITTILICGQKAKHAVLALHEQNRLARARVAVVMHLSPLAVNSHKAWLGKSGDERLALWAAEAVRQFAL